MTNKKIKRGRPFIFKEETKRIIILIDMNLFEKIHERIKELRTDMSKYIRGLIADDLKQNKEVKVK